MRRGPAAVAAILQERIHLKAPPVRVRELTTRILLEKQWSDSEAEAEETAESWEAQILARLQREHNTLAEQGRMSRFAFNSSDDRMIQGACFPEPRDDEVTLERKDRRSRAADYLAAFDSLNPSEFELLCGRLLELFGVDEPTVTRRSADEGIDFYGRLAFENVFFREDLSSNLQRQMGVWLVGQAKLLGATQAGTPLIRELVGSISLARSGTFGSRTAPHAGLDIRVADPVFALFITSGSLSGDAWRLLQRSGVIGMDGEMLAAFLADRSAGIGADGTLTMEGFRSWLESS